MGAEGRSHRLAHNQAPRKRPQMKPVALVVFLCLCGPALAEIETARDAMDAGDFVAAMAELLPAARAGNAEAEELIGVMYASGLGVERDDVRAFDWYLRASMKGHPGAQSGVGWYYEVGRGMPCTRPGARLYVVRPFRHRRGPRCRHFPRGSGEKDDASANRSSP